MTPKKPYQPTLQELKNEVAVLQDERDTALSQLEQQTGAKFIPAESLPNSLPPDIQTVVKYLEEKAAKLMEREEELLRATKEGEQPSLVDYLMGLVSKQQETIQVLSEALASSKSRGSGVIPLPGRLPGGPMTQEALEKINAGQAERQESSKEKPLKGCRPGMTFFPHDFIPFQPGAVQEGDGAKEEQETEAKADG